MKESKVFGVAPNEACASKIANHKKFEVYRKRVSTRKDYELVEKEFKYWNEQFKGLENIEVTLIENPLSGVVSNVIIPEYKERFISLVKEGNAKGIPSEMLVRDCFITVTVFEK